MMAWVNQMVLGLRRACQQKAVPLSTGVLVPGQTSLSNCFAEFSPTLFKRKWGLTVAIAFMRAAWSAGSKREGRGLKNQVDVFFTEQCGADKSFEHGAWQRKWALYSSSASPNLCSWKSPESFGQDMTRSFFACDVRPANDALAIWLATSFSDLLGKSWGSRSVLWNFGTVSKPPAVSEAQRGHHELATWQPCAACWTSSLFVAKPIFNVFIFLQFREAPWEIWRDMREGPNCCCFERRLWWRMQLRTASPLCWPSAFREGEIQMERAFGRNSEMTQLSRCK